MFEKSDHRFLQTLDSPEEFGKRLKKTRFQRRLFTFYAIGGALSAVVMMFVANEIGRNFPNGMQSQMMLLAVALLFMPVIHLIKAMSLHAEIRTLLMFRKLTERGIGENLPEKKD